MATRKERASGLPLAWGPGWDPDWGLIMNCSSELSPECLEQIPALAKQGARTLQLPPWLSSHTPLGTSLSPQGANWEPRHVA